MAQPPSNRPGDPRDPGDEPDDSDHSSGRGQNPFAGTPLEQLFSAFGSGQGAGGAAAIPDLSALMAQVQRMLTPYDGNVNWTLAKETARAAVAQSSDPTPTSADQQAVAEAVRLAELWLDAACRFGSGAGRTAAWSRAEWIEATMPVWEQIVEPVAGSVTAAMQQALPEEVRTVAGPMMALLGQAGGSMFGAQVGQAVGALAGEVVSSTDVGIPLTSGDVAALVPVNAAAFGAGLGCEPSDVLLYLALRECAHQRLFRHVPWLRAHLMGAVSDYARGTTIDVSRVEQSLSSLDPTNLDAVQEAMSGGLFEPERTPEQQAALDRLETLLALVEGWVDEVVGQATQERMPAAASLREAVRRRRAAGGPAEQTFASLVGLELRPRRLRDAATLWGAMRDAHGVDARDAVWAHPDLMPTATDLDDPLGFAADGAEAGDAPTSEEFDEALARLLDEGGESKA